ncbi:ABC transporter ATP-binding protein [Sporolactobacillus laevolacticus]|uniref:Putative hemin import ATP-binding protein HrtA n=1 Tax=Sporolactobacillus laevolacticus DSM 442 TaxID=1395513 RepID=V6J1X8_9BACL|nr:ABC transporter ATP-binding protein [Sporolactobacillus laevolacticus]EST10754.1 peptide ABC transporter ATP-binding protein [Sporolactobacillus laevolacticus DSM 442]
MSILKIQNASKIYGSGHTQVNALKPTHFTAETGELIAVIGPSGSGKSTFLTIAGGLQKPTEGSVLINGQDVTELSEKKRSMIRLSEVGFILQASNLIPYLTVDNQFRLLDKVKKGNMNPNEKDKLFNQLGIEDLIKKYPADLSGGEKQRVAIAKALYTKPSLLLADEPTASLDSNRAFEVISILSLEVKEKNKAAIMVTHDNRLTKYCDKVFVIIDGQLSQISDGDQAYAHLNSSD